MSELAAITFSLVRDAAVRIRSVLLSHLTKGDFLNPDLGSFLEEDVTMAELNKLFCSFTCYTIHGRYCKVNISEDDSFCRESKFTM